MVETWPHTVFETPGKQLQQDAMIDAGEIAYYVDLAVPGKSPGEMLAPLDGGDGPLAGTAGVAVENQSAFQHGAYMCNNSMMQNPVAKDGRMNNSRLGVEDLERPHRT